MSMTSLSLRARLTVWYTLALAAVLGLFSAEILWTQQRLGTNRIDRELDAMAATVWNVVRSELQEQNSPVAAAEEARSTVALAGRAVTIFDAAGRPLAADWSGLPPPALLLLDHPTRTTWTVQTPAGAWRVRLEPRTYESTTLLVLVAGSLADVGRERHEILEAMFVGIPVALLLAGVGGLWIASVGLRPITRMARLAGQIPLTGMEDLGHTERSDELGQLARAFNALVTRLRVALQAQRQFMADASHELRTPVSVIRAASDVTLKLGHRQEAEYREALAVTGDQARRLGRLVEDMLVLARADAGGSQLRPVDLYLDEVIAECRRAVEVLATERGVAVGSPSLAETPFRGDEDLLRRMIVNLLQNAVQHAPAESRVEIDLRQDAGTIRISVSDRGPGIPETDRSRIFDRFVQLDGARRGSGTGLGLPIARWIAEAHGGTLVLESSGPHGSTFCASFPHRGS
jgi:two-component system, OmpR family, sensor kinase